MENEATAQTAEPETQTTGDTAQDSTTQEQTVGQVDAKQETASSGDAANGIPKGLKKDLFDLRQKNREYRANMQRMEQELNTLKASVAPAKPPVNQEVSNATNLFDNPDQFMASHSQKLLGEVGSLLDKKLQEREQQQRHFAAAADAEKWLLSQKDLGSDPAALDEINEILNDPELSQVARVSPKHAARLAYSEWREKKGLGVDRDAKASAARASGVAPSAAGSSGQKTWSKAEIEKYLDPKHPEFQKRWNEVLKAQQEGRIK